MLEVGGRHGCVAARTRARARGVADEDDILDGRLEATLEKVYFPRESLLSLTIEAPNAGATRVRWRAPADSNEDATHRRYPRGRDDARGAGTHLRVFGGSATH